VVRPTQATAPEKPVDAADLLAAKRRVRERFQEGDEKQT
jgi:hypothetical protein